MNDPHAIAELPYKVAVLCYLYDNDDRLLLLLRSKDPNAGSYSPIGGKLEAAIGESPHACAIREILEESTVVVLPNDIRLCGMIAETAYENETHWMIFLYEVTRPIDPNEIESMEIDEGKLEWVAVDDVESLHIPQTDRENYLATCQTTSRRILRNSYRLHNNTIHLDNSRGMEKQLMFEVSVATSFSCDSRSHDCGC